MKCQKITKVPESTILRYFLLKYSIIHEGIEYPRQIKLPGKNKEEVVDLLLALAGDTTILISEIL